MPLNKLLFFEGSIVCSSIQQITSQRDKSKEKGLLFQTQKQEMLRLCQKGAKKKILTDSSVRGALWASSNPSPATVATTIQITQLSYAVTSTPLLSNPYPQQDILRLAGIQCQYSLRPQPVVQSWKLHHQAKMVLFQWRSSTLSKHSSAATSYAEFSSRRNFSSSED